MYISLYTARQLKRLKDRLLWYGLFSASGGGAALLYNTVLHDSMRWGWALAAFLLLCVGLYLVVMALGKLHIKDAYVAISPISISYRLHFFASESVIDWQQVADIQLGQQCVLFNLYGGGQKTLNLSAISSPNVASQVVMSVHDAALKHNLSLNSFPASESGVAKSMY
jgi:hypothetical protein